MEIEPTEFYLAYDASNLYLGVRCTQSDPSSFTIAAVERDQSVSRDDCVGFFICADPGERQFQQIYVNPDGVVFDQQLRVVEPGRYEGDGPAWNVEASIATRKGDGVWEMEAAIPHSSLGAATPPPGSRWRINFRRKEIARGSSADWQVPISYEPSQFGYMVFE